MYEIYQTGIQVNNTCWELEIPDQVYRNGTTWYTHNPMGCEIRENIHICPRKSARKETRCLSSDIRSCQLHRIECDTKILQTMSGVLVRTEKNVMGTETYPNGKLNPVKKSEHNVVFLEYERTKEMLIGDQLLRGMDEEAYYIRLDIGNRTEWSQMIKEGIQEGQNINVSKLAVDMEKQRRILEQIKGEKDWHSGGKWTLMITGITAVVASLVIQWGVLWIWWQQKTRQQGGRTKVDQDERRGLKRGCTEMEI